ncbi:MAG: beta-N-acetylhexosaminidase [Alistipes sp.]|nr:beta-N-acetylhexosaminidase [Alistipes sp.]
MKSRFTLLLFIATVLTTAAYAIVPQPSSVTEKSGAFIIMPSTTVVYSDDELRPLVVYMLDYLGVKHVSRTARPKNCILLQIDPELEGEAYILAIDGTRISVKGGSYGGVFNGIQSLFQLMPSDVYTRRCRLPATVNCCTIKDAPRFEYRGFMLDVARTWIDIDKVKHYIDILSYHKINKLHLHLTDDEGWRIEIKSHPELTEAGAWRGGSSPIKSVYGKWGETYGGYFTQRQMKEIIEYAAIRNIEIIPEIDLPGHSRTMANIHPEILCDYEPNRNTTNGYEYRSAWCASEESNYKLLEDILGEICQLFPSKFIHIGGDEVEMSQWRQCPRCSAFAARNGYDDIRRLEDRFMSEAGKIIGRYGKTPAVWNEAVNGGTLPRTVRVHGWENTERCLAATGKGYKTVVMPGQYFYLDMRQSPREDGHNWAAIFDTEQCYSFDFAEQGFTEEHLRNVIGVEATFFSELYVSHTPETLDYLHYQTFPRLCAVAEIGWGKYGSSLQDFTDRLRSKHYDRLASMGIRFRLAPPSVSYSNGRLSASTDENATIFYCKENENSKTRYIHPFKTDKPAEYLFWSEYRSGTSAKTGISEHYAVIKPAFRLTSSMEAAERAPFSRVESYTSGARTVRTCKQGDWFLFEFDTPVECREIEFTTGYDHLPKCIFDSGFLETSIDGISFERAAVLHGGKARLINPQRIKAARIVSTCDGNGTPTVIIQPPKIKPIL